MPVLLGEKYVELFANNSLKMSVLLDVSSGKVCSIVCLTVTLRKYCYCLMHGKVCSIVCLTVTLRKYCYCLMHGKVCSIVWE